MDFVAYLWKWLLESGVWEKVLVGVLSGIIIALLRYLWRRIRDRFWPKHQFDPDVPLPRQDWVPRDNELDKILHHFFPTHADAAAITRKARLVLVHGDGGFGKSTLAAHFAHRYAGRFAQVWWIPSETGRERRRKWTAINRRRHETTKPILYVFDNVDNVGEDSKKNDVLYDVSEDTKNSFGFLVDTLPDNACVLVTSRTARWLQDAEPIELRGLDVVPAGEFLRRLVKGKGVDGSEKSKDVVGSERLARALGGQPLALIHAGTTCREEPDLSFDDYRKDLSGYLEKALPPGAGYDTTEYAVVTDSLDRLAKRGGEAVTRLVFFLAFCAADRIPRSLYKLALNDPAGVNSAVEALRKVALVGDANAFQDRDPALSMHRVVQAIIRHEVMTKDAEFGASVISRLLKFLYDELLSTKAAGEGLRFQKYLPHLLQVLQYLEEPAFRRSDRGDLLDATVKQVVLKLAKLLKTASNDERKEYVPDLPKLVGRFYEVDPLGKLLDVVLARMPLDSTTWRAFRDDCLKADNYVLRYALADALAGRAASDAKGTMREIGDLLGKPLNHFELGGYALKSVYSEMPAHGWLWGLVDRLFAHVRGTRDSRINTALLSRLVEHDCYPGRSILGDLMLNLVYQRKSPGHLLPPGEGKNHRFWRPVWDFVKYDVHAVHAAEYVNSKTPLPPEAEREYDYRKQLETWRAELIGRLRHVPKVRGIVRDYFTIGADPDRITDDDTVKSELGKLAGAEFRKGGPALFSEVLGLLFGHPLWSVAEAAASVVAELLRDAAKDRREQEKNSYVATIDALFERSLPWRVRYGAMETAYQIRLDEDPDMATFGRGVKIFYNDQGASKLRGLCAENLFSVMLNASDRRREALEAEFGDQIRHWLKDEDCWVLDHIHRYFHTLHLRGVDVSRFTSAQGSRLFVGLRSWWTDDREVFLGHIERQKEKLTT